MEKFIFDSAVRGYHVYKDVWKPATGEKLHAEHEPGNTVNKFAMKVVKNIYLASTREFCVILAHVAERYAWK